MTKIEWTRGLFVSQLVDIAIQFSQLISKHLSCFLSIIGDWANPPSCINRPFQHNFCVFSFCNKIRQKRLAKQFCSFSAYTKKILSFQWVSTLSLFFTVNRTNSLSFDMFLQPHNYSPIGHMNCYGRVYSFPLVPCIYRTFAVKYSSYICSFGWLQKRNWVRWHICESHRLDFLITLPVVSLFIIHRYSL